MNRLSEEKAQVIAAEYCTNGHKKSRAMIDVGYAESYATSGEGLKVYDNVRVIEAIKAFMAKVSEKVENKAEDILRGIMSIAYPGTDADGNAIVVNTGDRLRAMELLGKNLKMWTDRTEHVSEAPQRPLTEDEQAYVDAQVKGLKIHKAQGRA